MKKVLIITSPRAPGWLESSSEVARGFVAFAAGVSDETARVYVTTYDRLLFEISDTRVAVWDDYNKLDLSAFDLIHLRNTEKSVVVQDFAKAISVYAFFHSVKVIEEVDQGNALGKLSQMILFKLNGLPVPHTVACWDNATLLARAAELPVPLIVKANNAMQGADNYKIASAGELEQLLTGSEQRFVAQEFIPNEGDFRVLFIGNHDHPLIFKRSSVAGSHLNNTSRGAQAIRYDVADFDKAALEMCVRAARLVERKITGIDIMQDSRDGSWVLLEANVTPALSMGAFLDEKISMYNHMVHDIFKEEA